jgi:RNA polymerase sigma-70 factor (ECF subfamily)
VKEAVHIAGTKPHGPDLKDLLVQVARGEQDAFAGVYDLVAGPVLGLVRSVLRDPAQSEEVTHEVLVEVWRRAAHFQPEKGSAMGWVRTLAHRRAVDRVRSAQRSSDREQRAALLDRTPAFDEVTEQGGVAAGARAGAPVPARADRTPARVGGAGLLPRPDLPRGRRTAELSAGDRQDAAA